jgi:hypothetical protein
MGLGEFKNGRYQPISSYKGSWAESEEIRKRAPELLEILQRTNQPMGSSTGRAIYQSIVAGKIDEARTVFNNDGDKLTQYPELEKWVVDNLGCRTHGVVGCKERFCRL